MDRPGRPTASRRGLTLQHKGQPVVRPGQLQRQNTVVDGLSGACGLVLIGQEGCLRVRSGAGVKHLR